MAKVFVAMYNFARHKKDENILPPFYDAFVNGLKNSGNDVLCYFHKEWRKDFSGDIPEDVLSDMRAFDADMYIIFTAHFWDVTKYFDKPVIIYDVDSPTAYNNTIGIKRAPGLHKFISMQESCIPMIRDMFGVPEKNICYIPPFTEIHSEANAKCEHNIGFVGANMIWAGVRFVHDFVTKEPTPEEMEAALRAYRRYETHPFNENGELYESIGAPYAAFKRACGSWPDH